MSEPRCEGCKFWGGIAGHDPYLGDCRRYPNLVRQRFDYWCGEFQPKETTCQPSENGSSAADTFRADADVKDSGTESTQPSRARPDPSYASAKTRFAGGADGGGSASDAEATDPSRAKSAVVEEDIPSRTPTTVERAGSDATASESSAQTAPPLPGSVREAVERLRIELDGTAADRAEGCGVSYEDLEEVEKESRALLSALEAAAADQSKDQIQDGAQGEKGPIMPAMEPPTAPLSAPAEAEGGQ